MWLGNGAVPARTAKWSPSGWGNLERGEREVTADVLFLALYVLSYGPPDGPRPAPVTMADLFETPGDLASLATSGTTLGDLRDAPVTGHVVTGRLPMGGVPFTAGMARALVSGASSEQVWPDDDPATRPSAREVHRKVEQQTLTETVAQRLDCPPAVVARLQDQVYGRPLVDERNERAGEGASAQAMGHVTRAIVRELRAWLDAHPDQAYPEDAPSPSPDPRPAAP